MRQSMNIFHWKIAPKSDIKNTYLSIFLQSDLPEDKSLHAGNNQKDFFALVDFRRRILLEAHINSDWPWWDIRWAPVRRRSSRFCWSRIIRTWCASRSGHPVDCWACLPSNTARNLSRPSWLVRTSYQGSDSGRWRVWERISSTL